MSKGKSEWDVGGEGAGDEDRGIGLTIFFVMDVGKEGCLHTFINVVVAVVEGSFLKKFELVVIWVGLDVD